MLDHIFSVTVRGDSSLARTRWFSPDSLEWREVSNGTQQTQREPPFRVSGSTLVPPWPELGVNLVCQESCCKPVSPLVGNVPS